MTPGILVHAADPGGVRTTIERPIPGRPFRRLPDALCLGSRKSWANGNVHRLDATPAAKAQSARILLGMEVSITRRRKQPSQGNARQIQRFCRGIVDY